MALARFQVMGQQRLGVLSVMTLLPRAVAHMSARSSRPSPSVLTNRRRDKARRAFCKSNNTYMLTCRPPTVRASKTGLGDDPRRDTGVRPG